MIAANQYGYSTTLAGSSRSSAWSPSGSPEQETSPAPEDERVSMSTMKRPGPFGRNSPITENLIKCREGERDQSLRSLPDYTPIFQINALTCPEAGLRVVRDLLRQDTHLHSDRVPEFFSRFAESSLISGYGPVPAIPITASAGERNEKLDRTTPAPPFRIRRENSSGTCVGELRHWVNGLAKTGNRVTPAGGIVL